MAKQTSIGQKNKELASPELIKLIENSVSTGVVNFPAGTSISAVHNSLLKMTEEDSGNVISKHFIFNQLELAEPRIKIINSWSELFFINQITFNKCSITDYVTIRDLKVDKINFDGTYFTGNFKIDQIKATQKATELRNSKDVIDFHKNTEARILAGALIILEESKEIVKFPHIRFNKFKFNDFDINVFNSAIRRLKTSEVTLIDCSIVNNSKKFLSSPKINILSSKNTNICTNLAGFINRILKSKKVNSKIVIENYNYPHELFEEFILDSSEIPLYTKSLTLKNINADDKSINSLIEVINKKQFENLEALTLNGDSFEHSSSIQKLVDCSVKNKNVNLIFNDPKNQHIDEIIKKIKDFFCKLVERQNLHKQLYEIFNKETDDCIEINHYIKPKEQILPENIISYSTAENITNESHTAGDLQITHD